MSKHLIISIFILSSIPGMAQDKSITRIARINVDSTQLTAYMALLNEQMNAAVKLEPGVISYQVYADKLHPQNLTLVEVYASNDAYLEHREAAHFKKYKSATKDMVKSLELAEVIPVLAAGKENEP